MAAVNADSVFFQIVAIAKSNASEHDCRRRVARRIKQFVADVARSPHPREINERNKERLCEMLQAAAKGGTMSARGKAAFLMALEGLDATSRADEAAAGGDGIFVV
jgi:hypothetical protein